MNTLKVMLASCLFISLAATGCTQNTPITSSIELRAALEKYINQLDQQGTYGSFLVMEKESIFFEKSIGFANKSKKLKANANTVYPYGSITKEYTQAIILQLILENQLNPMDKLSQFFNKVPDDKKGITLAQLLNHRSGIAEYHDAPFRDKYPGVPADFYPITPQEALETIFKLPLQFEPDSDEGYSNSGYTLLAFIAEKVTDQSYEDLVHQRILQPAKTKTTDFSSSLKWTPTQVAIGYDDLQYGQENSAYYWPRNPMPCYGNGGLAGSLTDLYRGLRFMVQKEIQEEAYEKLAQQFRYVKDLPDNFITYGGGDDLGFVAGYFVDKTTDRYFLFALNNNKGDEHANMLRDLVLMLFGFDFASIVPEYFTEENHSVDQEVHLSKEDIKGKWNLPNNREFQKVKALLDYLSGEKTMPLQQFLDHHCIPNMDKKSIKTLKDFPITSALQFNQISSTGKSMQLSIMDEAKQQAYLVKLKINTKINQFKGINIEQK